MEKQERIIKVTCKQTGRVIEVGKQGVTSIYPSGSLSLACICQDHKMVDTCSIDPRWAIVEFAENE